MIKKFIEVTEFDHTDEPITAFIKGFARVGVPLAILRIAAVSIKNGIKLFKK